MDRSQQARRQGEELSRVLDADSAGRLAELDRDLIEARVREVIRLRMLGRQLEAEAFYAPSIVVESVGPAALRPWTGRFAGLDELRQFRKDVVTELEPIDGEVLDLAVDGQVCLVRRRVRYRNRGSGEPMSFYVWEKYRFEGAAIAEIVQHMDTATLAVLAGRVDVLSGWLPEPPSES